MAANRLRTIAETVPGASMQSTPCAAPTGEDIVIVSGCRTPMTKSRKGLLKDTTCADMLAVALKEAIRRAGVRPDQIDDVVVGNVGQDGAGALQARLATFLAGIPKESSVMALNRQCSSGLTSIAAVASSIRSGFIDVGIAAGVESMSMSAKKPPPRVPDDMSHRLAEGQQVRDCLTPMGITSENVAKDFGIGRAEQDAFALRSYEKALAAQAAGLFDCEIVPVTTNVKDKEGKKQRVTVTKDDGPRPTTLENLGKLKPAFKADGCSHAGNSSQTTDGASAVVMCKRSMAEKMGLPILGVFRGFKVTGVPPRVMGIGPAVAIPAVLKQTGLSVSDIDIFELNEAFASQALYCMKKLELPAEKVNPQGGAIALGHPLGMTGTRCAVSLLYQLQRSGKDRGVVSMCIGTGMGAAGVFSRN
eukprot:TRINITY_DN509_c0_g1_i1.p2 TRINITY_DN509_c0_g1~~TRINITY_DN509_c0_g1_i1.p2  ORF type:complete len:439 (+),score=159.19 TRINITY_DN509_c0_g1_i1:65-1318(+)